MDSVLRGITDAEEEAKSRLIGRWLRELSPVQSAALGSLSVEHNPGPVEGANFDPDWGEVGRGQGADADSNHAEEGHAERTVAEGEQDQTEREVGGLDLNEREREILRALVLVHADAERRSVARLKAARKADPACPASSYNQAVASLVKKKLVGSKRGPRGGIWLTPMGLSAANTLANRPSTK